MKIISSKYKKYIESLLECMETLINKELSQMGLYFYNDFFKINNLQSKLKQ